MTMRRTILLASLVGFLGGLLGGCAALRQARRFERPRLEYESCSAALDLEGVSVALHLRLENPNDFGLELRRLGYRLEVEDRRLGEGELPGGLSVGPRAWAAVTVPVRVLWRDVPGIAEVVLGRDAVAYRVSGSAAVGSPLGEIDVPFDRRDRLALPRLPAIRLSP
jgi:LEA14-like dessication related protein